MKTFEVLDEVLETKLESILRVELLTKILSVGCDELPIELTVRFWSAVAHLLSCRVQDDGEENMSGQAMGCQADPGTPYVMAIIALIPK